MLTNADITTLQRLINAAVEIRIQSDTGVLFEGYDGAEPQRTQAVAALDELEDATAAAIATLQSLITRNAARNVEHF